MRKIASVIDNEMKKLASAGVVTDIKPADVDQMIMSKRAFLVTWLDNNLDSTNTGISKSARKEILENADEAVPATLMTSVDLEKFAEICDEALSEATLEYVAKNSKGQTKKAAAEEILEELLSSLDGQDEQNLAGLFNYNPQDFSEDGDRKQAEDKANQILGDMTTGDWTNLDGRMVADSMIPDLSNWSSLDGDFGISPSAPKLGSASEIAIVRAMQKIAEAAEAIKEQALTNDDEKAMEVNNGDSAAKPAAELANNGAKGSVLEKDKVKDPNLTQFAKDSIGDNTNSKYFGKDKVVTKEEGNVDAIKQQGEEDNLKGVSGTQEAKNASAQLEALMSSIEKVLKH